LNTNNTNNVNDMRSASANKEAAENIEVEIVIDSMERFVNNQWSRDLRRGSFGLS